MARPGDTLHDLTEALRALRAAVVESSYPLDLPSARSARADAAALVQQVDDYLLPRLQGLDAPLLAVVGGSTGAGKSTLVNSLVRAPVSAAGVMRPTTRSPVLVCHPADAGWFRGGTRLGGFTRIGEHSPDPYRLQHVVAPALPEGLALLDTPDVDSVVDVHRDVAVQLLAAADLWLFVTTANRYADAVPWELLSTARERGTAVAVVLDRVPHQAAPEVTAHLSEMLGERGFGGVPLFVLPETWVDGQGMLPEAATAQLRSWLNEVARDERARDTVIRLTLDGALAALPATAQALARATDEQFAVAEVLAEQVGLAYGTARSTVEHAIRSGTMLRGEVLARWRELVRTGEWAQVVRAAVPRWRDRASGPVTGQPSVGQELRTALAASAVTLVRSAAADATDAVAAAWRAQSGPVELPMEPAERQLDQVLYEWQRGLLDLVRAELAGSGERLTTFVANATGLLTMIGAFAAATPAGTTAITGEEELASPLSDPTIRKLAEQGRADLVDRVGAFLDDEAAGYLTRLASVPLDDTPAQRLREAAAELERTRDAAQLCADLDDAEAPTPEPATPAEDHYAGDRAARPDAEPIGATPGEPAAQQEAGR